MRTSRAIRATAWAVVVAGIAAPLLRRRLRLPAPVTLGTAAAAPVALCVVEPRSRLRDVATCMLQMWAYIAAYEGPFDDPDALRRRVHIDYPVAVDRALGAGQVPTLRLQRVLGRPDGITARDKVLVWAHWMWFFVPHATLVYILARHPERFTRAAVHTYATFDIGVLGYWAMPTAPPWYAHQQGHVVEAGEQGVRRMMIEYGEQFWKERWGPLYSLLGGNPLAAMPSLHFATSVMAAHLLAETGPLAGGVGWTYALTLGFALVYLGEHYVVDLLAGLTLTESIRALGPRAAPALRRVSRAIQSLEVRART